MSHPLFTLTEKHEQAFIDLKKALPTSPALGLPDYDQSFILFLHDRNNQASGVLTQDKGERMRPSA